MFLEIFKKWRQVSFESLRSGFEGSFLIFGVDNVNFIRGQENVSVRIVIENVTFLDVLPLSQHAVDNGEGRSKEIFLRNDAHHLECISQGFGQDMRKQVDGIGKNMGVIADEDHPVLQHHDSIDIEQYIKGEYGQDGKGPLIDEVSLRQVPVSQQNNLLVVDQFELIGAIEGHFSRIEVFHAT